MMNPEVCGIRRESECYQKIIHSSSFPVLSYGYSSKYTKSVYIHFSASPNLCLRDSKYIAFFCPPIQSEVGMRPNQVFDLSQSYWCLNHVLSVSFKSPIFINNSGRTGLMKVANDFFLITDLSRILFWASSYTKWMNITDLQTITIYFHCIFLLSPHNVFY